MSAGNQRHKKPTTSTKLITMKNPSEMQYNQKLEQALEGGTLETPDAHRKKDHRITEL